MATTRNGQAKADPAKTTEITVTLKTERASIMRAALQEEKEIRLIVREYVADQMVEGVDYGAMPGVKAKDGEAPKKILMKPGAEKLFDIFKCRPEYDFLDKTVDPDGGLYYYEIRCRAVNRESGTVLNEGLGSASSYESKYRYRSADRVCPECGKATIIKGKAEYGGGWVCFAKKGGCGAKWQDGAPEIERQEAGKVQNPDLADIANTVLKIAKKRAQVDCAIGLARVSDLFTQDLDDLPALTTEAEVKAAAGAKAAEPRKAAKRDAPVDADALWRRLNARGLSREGLGAFITRALGRKASGSFSALPQADLLRIQAALDAQGATPNATASEVEQALAEARAAAGGDEPIDNDPTNDADPHEEP